MNSWTAEGERRQMTPSADESAGEKAKRKVAQYETTSRLVKPARRRSVEPLCWDDIELGRILDKGSFSSVYEATLRRDMYDPPPVYAVKCLKDCMTEQEDTFVTGAVDLALEAKILAKLMHPNIIRLHGSHSGCISETFQNGRGFFLVLDLMVDTLDKRLVRWSHEHIGTPFFLRSSRQRKKRLSDRIEYVALGVAEGLEYIHSRQVLFRDLKPANIGFDEAGNVRIFDFGLAREADDKGRLRQMTGNAGTPRYMAPEVAAERHDQIGFASDVYSYSILLWELLTLEKPFESIKSISQFNEEVVRRHNRPPLKKVPLRELRMLLEECWDKDHEKRPEFSEVCRVLRKLVPQTDASELSTSSSSWQAFEEGNRGETSNETFPSSQCKKGESYGMPRQMTTSNKTASTRTLMSSRTTSVPDSISDRRTPRYLSFWARQRKGSESPSPRTPVVQEDRYRERSWLERTLLRKATMSLDLSTRSFRIRKYDLGDPGSFRSGGSVHSSNEEDDGRRLSHNSVGSRRSSHNSIGSRRSSHNSDSHLEAMAATLAAEAKSNRKFLRELKRDKI